MPLQIFPMPLQSTAAIVVVDGIYSLCILCWQLQSKSVLSLLDALKNFVSGGGENGVYAVSWGMHEERCTKKVVSDRYKGLGKQELPTIGQDTWSHLI